MNFFRGTIRRDGERVEFAERNERPTALHVPLADALASKAAAYAGKDVVLGVRPETCTKSQTAAPATPRSSK